VLVIDPRSVEAKSRLAMKLTARVLDQMSPSVAADIARAEEQVRQAVEVAPSSLLVLAHYAKGQILRVHNRYAEAIPEYEIAIALNRNWVNALAGR
jgi:tetratricopeptide (TPR) repeat protein